MNINKEYIINLYELCVMRWHPKERKTKYIKTYQLYFTKCIAIFSKITNRTFKINILLHQENYKHNQHQSQTSGISGQFSLHRKFKHYCFERARQTGWLQILHIAFDFLTCILISSNLHKICNQKEFIFKKSKFPHIPTISNVECRVTPY